MVKEFVLEDYIVDIEINGLKGRMVDAPAMDPKAKGVNILYVHGHHSSLERLRGVAELLAEYGNVCMPDLPGFGGMDHLYKVDQDPTIDALADYLMSFIKLHYGARKKVTLIGLSTGFLVVTRMLQKYPDLSHRINGVISMAGFVHGDAFLFTPRRVLFYKFASKLFTYKTSSFLLRELMFRKWFIGTAYTKTRNAKARFIGFNKDELSKMIDFEVSLWRSNHVRTHFFTYLEMFKADLVTNATKIPLNLVHVSIGGDQYFDAKVVEQHLRIIYQKVKVIHHDMGKHAVSVVGSKADAEEFFPRAGRDYLRSLR
jgi:pimeloyl-ACP methyl ester carboxylesterase